MLQRQPRLCDDAAARFDQDPFQCETMQLFLPFTGCRDRLTELRQWDRRIRIRITYRKAAAYIQTMRLDAICVLQFCQEPSQDGNFRLKRLLFKDLGADMCMEAVKDDARGL